AEVGLVRRLVLGEPGIAVDPEDRPLRIRLERNPALVECICQRADERFHRLLEEFLVFRLAWLEPRAVVVLGELGEEVDRFGAEPRESVDSDGHGDDLLAALPSSYAGSLTYRSSRHHRHYPAHRERQTTARARARRRRSRGRARRLVPRKWTRSRVPPQR